MQQGLTWRYYQSSEKRQTVFSLRFDSYHPLLPPPILCDPPQHKHVHAISAPPPQIQHMAPIRRLFLALLAFHGIILISCIVIVFSLCTCSLCELSLQSQLHKLTSFQCHRAKAENIWTALAYSSDACCLIAIVPRLLCDWGIS